MHEIFSKALNEHITVGRIIDEIKGSKPGPSLIFTGGIHGNEPSGVFALHRVMREIRDQKVTVSGSIHAISGNLWALERGERFHKQDLNRLWRGETLEKLKDGTLTKENHDIGEQMEIHSVIETILTTEEGPFYFMDLHTTSAETIPFLTVNDSLLNRRFTEQYPAPMILGIEEYLDGPLLSYINELGYVAFGYEAGQHDELSSIENHVAFIYLSLVFSGAIKKEDIDFDHYYNVLAKTTIDSRGIFEIYYRHEIKEDEIFTMHPGYCNFQWVDKGQPLAVSNGVDIRATKKGRVFMPLYQSQGNDGFFAVRKISPVFLRISAALRRVHADRLLTWLPGINWASDKRDALIVNRRVARLMAKQFFHLMGYRSKRIDKTHLIVKNREASSRTDEYASVPWK